VVHQHDHPVAGMSFQSTLSMCFSSYSFNLLLPSCSCTKEAPQRREPWGQVSGIQFEENYDDGQKHAGW